MRKLFYSLIAALAFCASLPDFSYAETTPEIAAAEKIPAPYRAVLLYETAATGSDRAFTEAAKRGAEKAKQELGIAYEEVRLSPGNRDEAAREAALEKIASSGATQIIAVGFQNVVPVLKLAETHPTVQFTVIDGIVPPLFSNVQSVLFKDHEGAFLVGMIAAYTSRTGTIGFIGGMDVPLIRNFFFGYKQGAQYAKKEIKVISDMVGGSSATAWSDPSRAAQLASGQYEKGADVIFAAAGGSGLGVLSAAEQEHKLAIGVDTNQNGLYPGSVLTSMVKRVDLAVFNALKQGKETTWQPGIKYLGVKESMLDFAVDRYNKDLISRDTIDKVEAAKELILRGLIDVQVYSPN